MIMYKIQNNTVGFKYLAFTTVSIYGCGVIWCAHKVTAILQQIYNDAKQSQAVYYY